MKHPLVSSLSLPDFPLWEKLKAKRAPLSFELEVTARCNNNCVHCYINLPAGDPAARARELSLAEIAEIGKEAVGLGAVWCLITGGEPLLREDFPDIYLALKRLGLLVSVFTNACLIRPEHVDLFRKYPPRDLEITVYGVTRTTYEGVTRQPGSFAAFQRGLNLLSEGGLTVRLKAMAIRANVHELPEIAEFCREHTRDYFRFDPFLHLRFDGDQGRNQEIKAQRLTPKEIASLERADPERWPALKEACEKLKVQEISTLPDRHLFFCGAGLGSFVVSPEGLFRLCSSLWHPDGIYDLRQGSLRHACQEFVMKVREWKTQFPQYLEKCSRCGLINLCLWCPAHAYLETGCLDTWVEYFCQVAQARAQLLGLI
jgi:radical SAM protein with 4Fe4S-binding SPASM domain